MTKAGLPRSPAFFTRHAPEHHERRPAAALFAPHPARRIGIEGQQRLLASHALVIGAGGLGSPVALYLGTAGVGRITLVDHDTVDLTNLQRQIAHTTAAWAAQGGIGRAAMRHQPRRAGHAGAAARRCRLLTTWCPRPTWCWTAATTSPPATPSTRLRAHRKPLVAGAAIRFDGQISVYDPREPRRPATPACSRPTPPSKKCSAPPWACSRRWWASSAAMQAAEALKLLPHPRHARLFRHTPASNGRW
jgi:hypothetical protein